MTELFKETDQQPFVIDFKELVMENDSYRKVIWTGNHIQALIMSIPENEEAGTEVHHNIDQYTRIEDGQGVCRMGPSPDEFTYERAITTNDTIFIPGNMWHNIINTGGRPLKLYTIYSIPEYAEGTIHHTREDATGHTLLSE